MVVFALLCFFVNLFSYLFFFCEKSQGISLANAWGNVKFLIQCLWQSEREQFSLYHCLVEIKPLMLEGTYKKRSNRKWLHRGLKRFAGEAFV